MYLKTKSQHHSAKLLTSEFLILYMSEKKWFYPKILRLAVKDESIVRTLFVSWKIISFQNYCFVLFQLFYSGDVWIWLNVRIMLSNSNIFCCRNIKLQKENIKPFQLSIDMLYLPFVSKGSKKSIYR